MKAAAKPTGAGPMAAMAKMDEHMKAMQAMHEKMLAAKTPVTACQREDGRWRYLNLPMSLKVTYE